MAGDVGFDPLGLSSIAGLAGADLYWMREAELKHCRIAMLAVVGVLWCDSVGSLPGFPSGVNQMKLFWEVWAEKPQYVAAGFIFCGIVESELHCIQSVLRMREVSFTYFVFVRRRGDPFLGFNVWCTSKYDMRIRSLRSNGTIGCNVERTFVLC